MITYPQNHGGYTVKKKTVTEKVYDEEGRLVTETVTEETETAYPGQYPYNINVRGVCSTTAENLKQQFSN